MDDERIVDLYWNREEEAITETARKYGSYCRMIASNILSNCEDVEECENDTYATLWNTIPPRRPLRFKAFLGKVARNLSLSKYDYNKAGKRNSNLTIALTELEECLVGKDSVESVLEKGELAKHISDFLRTLPLTQRQIFVRRYWYTDSIKTIARQFGYSESKIKSMLFRIRNKLKLYLEKEGISI